MTAKLSFKTFGINAQLKKVNKCSNTNLSEQISIRVYEKKTFMQSQTTDWFLIGIDAFTNQNKNLSTN